MSGKVSVVVTVLNEEKSIDLLLDALELQTYHPFKTIIVDGGSTDQTLQLIKARKNKNIKILQKIGNRSLGRNEGIEQVDTELIAITDAGCVPHPDWLEELVKCYRATDQKTDKQVVVAGYYDARTTSDFTEAVVPYVLVMPDQVDAKSFLPATRSMLLAKKTWHELGGFDERLSDNEDFAFAQKLKHSPQVHIAFTDQAKVTWLPRTTLRSFWYMIFRFARGDVAAGIIRPKVIMIFARYLFLVLLTLYLASLGSTATVVVLAALFFIYSVWAVSKNRKYAPHGWYWLPLLQITADMAVMAGSIAGLFNR